MGNKETVVLGHWEVYDCFSVDGMGPTEVIGRFWDQSVAEKFAEGRGNYKKKAYVKFVNIVICKSIEDIELQKLEKEKAAALSKLSKREREILGL